ncbi:peptidase M48 [Noviherbaspirillum cavernae]|uniref:Peptidase M48 n=2 Tax=Noviherbaspirillum cavernae TaxID=2320862 RepID=A0A418X5U9_9BURK|nr:peptidase M48 [Noviherbaspirillum cavernae]
MKVSRRLHVLHLVPAALLLSACATVELPPSRPAPGAAAEPARPAPDPAQIATPEEQALRSLVSLQDRLYRVAAPLLVSNPDLCRSNARNLLGFTAKNMYSYTGEYAAAAKTAFGMNDHLKVMGVLAGSGAARAGMRRGDDLISIEDKTMPTGPNAERQAATILAPLVSGRSNVKLTVMRDGRNVAMVVPLTYACAFGIELGNTDNIIAYGDGHRVLITRGMLNFTRTDDEVAYVMAKEMAHNALSHASRQRMSATVGGIIDNLIRIRPDMSTMGGMAGVKPMPQELDAAADKLSLYMLARAGYSIDGASAFWQRLAGQYPASVLNGYTALHPATAYRVSVMDKTVAEIKAKQAARKPLFP